MKYSKIQIKVQFKKIKNMYIRVYPPDGEVVVTAPELMTMDQIQKNLSVHKKWLSKKVLKFKSMKTLLDKQEALPEYLHVWGKLHKIVYREGQNKNSISMERSRINVYMRRGFDLEKKKKLLYDWTRRQLIEEAQVLLTKWENRIGVQVNRLQARKMKTRWGSCNIRKKKINLNTALFVLDKEALEYVLVHEMVHLIEPSHNHNFKTLMTAFLPDWKERKKLLLED